MGARNRYFIHYLPVLGCIATGIIYAAIGIIAILSFLKVKDGGADESSFINLLSKYFAGKILIGIILVGSVSYIIWRFFESVNDPYHYGNKAKGLAKRIGIALSSVADALIVFTAFQSIFGTSSEADNGLPTEERAMIKEVLQMESGKLIVMVLGAIVAFTAIVQLIYGFTGGYKERLESEKFKPLNAKIIHLLGLYGYLARGIIIGIIAFFYLKAGFENNAQLVVNTDKAFDFVGDNIGHLYFILLAAGTIFYGVFMFILSVAYDTDRD